MMKKIAVLGLIGQMFLASLSFANTDKDLNIAVQNFMDTWDPIFYNSNVTNRIYPNVFEGLLYIDYKDHSKIKTRLAERYEKINDTTWQFTLKKDVKFHNQKNLTADDVVFSLSMERFEGEATATAIYNTFLSTIESVKKIDEHTVQITSKGIDPVFLNRLASYPAYIVNKDAFEAAKDLGEWNRKPIGTGPYYIDEFKNNDYLLIKRFEQYWGSQAPASSIKWKKVPEVSSRVAGAISGEYDIVTDITPDQKSVLASNNLDVVGGSVMNIRGLIFSSKNNRLKNAKLRQALIHAIDRKLITSSLFADLAEVPNGWQMESFGNMYFDESEYKAPSFDKAKAEQLIKESGYNGEEINYFYLNDYYPMEVSTAKILEGMWKAVGLNVKITLKNNWDQIENDKTNTVDIYNMSATAYYSDPLGQFWRRFGTGSPFEKNGHIEVAEDLVEVSKPLLNSLDPDERRASLLKSLQTFDNNPQGMPLYTMILVYAKSKKVQWTPEPTEEMRLDSESFRYND